MSEFVKTMMEWRRMCNAFVKQYDNDCCKYCPLDHLKSCGAIWEIENGTYDNIAETVEVWNAEHPEPVYPMWGEWFVEHGDLVDGWQNATNAAWMANTALSVFMKPIPADIAEKLGLKPKGEGNDV